jgi:hypothetical protein
LFERLGRAGTAVAFVDLDQLRLCGPASDGDPMNHRVRALTLGAVWSGFLAAGARCVVLSGLVDDADDVARHADRLPGAELTVCRLRVGHDELRERVARRGSMVELAGESVRNATELDGTAFADLVVDTSGLTPAEVVARVRDSGWPGNLSTVDAEPGPEPVPPTRVNDDDAETSVLLLCGPPAVGKSAVGFDVYGRALRRGVRAAYVDLAQIGFCRPAPGDDPDNHRLKAHNLGRMWNEFRADGVRFLVVTGNVADPADIARYHAVVGPSAFSVCRLRARPETLTERILLRGRGGGPGLMGDDLRGRPEADLRRRAEEVARVAVALDRSRIGSSVVDTDGPLLADLVVHVSTHVAGRAVRTDLCPESDDGSAASATRSRSAGTRQEAVYGLPGQ